MGIDEYVNIVRETDQTRQVAPDRSEPVRKLGLAGQVGSLLSEFKKSLRDSTMLPLVRRRIKEEIGDILWYVVAISLDRKLNLIHDVLIPNLYKIHEIQKSRTEQQRQLFRRDDSDPSEISKALSRDRNDILPTFKSYQDLAVTTSHFSADKQIIPDIVRLWRQSELILQELEKDHPDVDLVSTLGDIMWYIVDLAHLFGFDMNVVAAENADKSLSRWSSQKLATPRYDANFKDLERFPDDFVVSFTAKNAKTSVMIINNVVIGDPLMDNIGEEDGYRFHDIFHFANLAILGWSPVGRALLKRKRKSCPIVDEIQDGGRAQVVEEAIVKMAHYYAVDCDKEFLLDNTIEIDFSLLKSVREMARDLEVHSARFWEWEKAILEGCKAYRKIWKAGGGCLSVSLRLREIRVI